MKLKRLISLLLCVCLLAGAMQIAAFAADPDTEDETVSDSGSATVTESADEASAATTAVTVTKVWDDADLLDLEGYERPESVTFLVTGTKEDGTAGGSAEVTVTAEDGWTKTVAMPAEDGSGVPITYTVTELPGEGYDTTAEETKETVENTADCTPCAVTVKKVDAATGTPLAGAAITVTDADNAVIDKKVTGKDGTAVFSLTEAGTYYIRETSAPKGYALSADSIELSVSAAGHKLVLSCDRAEHGVITIRDTSLTDMVPETGDGVITVTKVWNDAKIGETVPNYEYYYSRPTEITLTLTGKINGTTVVTRSASFVPMSIEEGFNEKPVIFSDLPLTASDGTKIEYSVTESWKASNEMSLKGYTYEKAVTWDGCDCTVTNTVSSCTLNGYSDGYDIPYYFDYKVTKDWDCDEALIPDSVTLHIEGANDSADITLKKADGWTGTVTDLYMGREYYAYDETTGWYTGGQYYTTSSETESSTVDENLTVSEPGCPAGFAMSGCEVYGPNSVSNGRGTGTITVTNTLSTGVSGIVIEKIWDDCGDADGLRPKQITGTLTAVCENPYRSGTLQYRLWEMANGGSKTVTVSFTLSEANNWQTFLPYSPNEYTLSVKEDSVKDYKTSYSTSAITKTESGASHVTCTITNTHTPDSITVPAELTVLKTSALNGDALQGAQFTAVKTDDSSVTSTVTTGTDGTAVFSFSEAGEYTISETVAPTGYEKSFTGCTVTVTEEQSRNAQGIPVYTYAVSGDAIENGTLSVSDTKLRETDDLVITKVWDDGNDAEGNRPDSVTVYAVSSDGRSYTETLTAENGWKVTVPDVYTQDTAYNTVTWTVTEEVPEGYIASVTGSGTVWTVTNACDYPTKSLTVTKTWNDSFRDDAGYTRPTGVTYAVEGWVNGEKISTETVTATESGDWTVTLSDLPATHKGETVNYVVKELTSTGYTPVTTQNVTTVTNTPRTGDDRYLNSTLTIVKTDADTGEKIGGAVFEISYAGSDTAPEKTETVTAPDGVATYLITEPGTYTVKEIPTDGGSSVSTETFTVTADFSTTPTVTKENGEFIRNYTMLLDGTENGVITVTAASDSEDSPAAEENTGNTPAASTVPQTGDCGITLWLALMAMSVFGLAALTGLRITRRRDEADL